MEPYTPAWAARIGLPDHAEVEYTRDALSALLLLGVAAWMLTVLLVSGPRGLVRIARKQVGA